MASASDGAFSTSGMERRHRCYLSIGPHIVQYSSARRADLYFAWALWTWKGENRGRSLFMYASGLDSLWQVRALVALRSVRVDTLDYMPNSAPR